MEMEPQIPWTIYIGHVVLLKGSLVSAQSPVEEALLLLLLFHAPLQPTRTTLIVNRTL